LSKARDISKLFTSDTSLVTNSELSSTLSSYLTTSSASSTYATQASLTNLDSDSNPDIFMNMGG
jgi:hypothetical protein